MKFRNTFARVATFAGAAALASTLMATPASAAAFGSTDQGKTQTVVAPAKFVSPGEPVEENSFRMAPPRQFIPYDNGARPTPTPPVCDIYTSKYNFVYGAKCVMPQVVQPGINPPPPALMGARG